MTNLEIAEVVLAHCNDVNKDDLIIRFVWSIIRYFTRNLYFSKNLQFSVFINWTMVYRSNSKPLEKEDKTDFTLLFKLPFYLNSKI